MPWAQPREERRGEGQRRSTASALGPAGGERAAGSPPGAPHGCHGPVPRPLLVQPVPQRSRPGRGKAWAAASSQLGEGARPGPGRPLIVRGKPAGPPASARARGSAEAPCGPAGGARRLPGGAGEVRAGSAAAPSRPPAGARSRAPGPGALPSPPSPPPQASPGPKGRRSSSKRDVTDLASGRGAGTRERETPLGPPRG